VSTEFTWHAKDGTKMYGRQWPCGTDPKGLVCFVHGFGEHVGRYSHVAGYLNGAGWDAAGFDHRGHGQSGGRRGCLPYADAPLDDIQAFLDAQEETYGSKPKVLYGHSMGGSLVLCYLVDYAQGSVPSAAIVSGPGLALPGRKADTPPWIQKLFRWAVKLRPHSTIKAKLPASYLSRDEQVVADYEQDPLVHSEMSYRLSDALGQWADRALNAANRLSVPLLLMHGQEDRICLPEGSQRFARSAPGVTMKIWPEAYHELHNDLDWKQVLGTVVDWLQTL